MKDLNTKKTRSRRATPEMRPEYDFSGGIRGKYADRYRQGTNLILLDPELAKAFPDSKAVNDALRTLPSKRVLLGSVSMIATLPTQEQVDRIASGLDPDVVHIRFAADRDWSEHPALYFRVILSDEASRKERLADVTGLVRTKISEELRLPELEHIPYFRFRSQSEQAKLREEAWV
jgi:hypothetical protein